MKISTEEIVKKLSEKGLKITPQRVNILAAIHDLNNHPTADNILDHIRESHPNIATGTVYKVLDTLVENQLIKRVKTGRDIMRYDGITEKHHHLYSTKDDVIEDYFDEELNELIKEHFRKKKITGFKIEDIVLQIRGTFK
jgi:Fur family peroxide stress response transcriptional regulator